jgi:ribosomal protein L34
LFPTSRWWRLQTCYGRYVLSVQRLKSPLEGFSPGVHLRGRCHGDRIGGRPARSVRSGAVSTACLSLTAQRGCGIWRPGRRCGGSLFPTSRWWRLQTCYGRYVLSVQRLKSPLEGFSPGVHLRGRCHGDRIGGRPARSVRSGAVSTACLSLTAQRGCGIRRPGRRCGGSLFPTSRWWRLQTCYGRYVLSVQRLKSPLEGFSPGVHLRGRCHGDRIGGRPARSVRSGAVYGL